MNYSINKLECQYWFQTTAVPGVFEALRHLGDKKFGSNIFLVSKCGRKTQEKTLQWLEYHHFSELTGIGPDRVYNGTKKPESVKVLELLISSMIDWKF